LMSRTQKLKELVAASLILKTLNDNPYGMVTGLGAKIHAPCPVSKEHYFLK